MSAVTWDDVALIRAADEVVRMPRRHLTLVPAGPEVRAEAGAEAPLRLTRRGRLAVAGLLVGGAVLGSAISGGWGVAGADPAASARPATTVTVVWGDTLSQVAARELPTLPIAEGVARIQLANRLNTTAISAGQTLVIPAS
ncbi:MAG TPA: LysM peptidoglycan-binding domain-containing protein [Phycicoccus sp.]|nr:LysM peptidoglycan-binding domain-containing protein [Phycicoccus sp.]